MPARFIYVLFYGGIQAYSMFYENYSWSLAQYPPKFQALAPFSLKSPVYFADRFKTS